MLPGIQQSSRLSGVPGREQGRHGRLQFLQSLTGESGKGHVPGTTRDTVEETVLCGGVLLRLIDTAGLRETEDLVEQQGVELSAS